MIKDLTNQKFGSLTPLSGSRDKNIKYVRIY